MSRGAHFIYISFFVATTLIVVVYLAFNGFSYYNQSLEERYYHPDNDNLKSSGFVGHSLGITGSFLIITGVGTYMARKRYRALYRLGILKHWLEMHIFFCVLGTFLIVFHTAFKFGGLAAVSFWSMTIAFLSGIAGRVIYIQIPRTLEGQEYDLKEVREIRNGIVGRIKDSHNLDAESFNFISVTIENRASAYPGKLLPRFLKKFRDDRKAKGEIKNFLHSIGLKRSDRHEIMSLVRDDIKLERRIERLGLMKNLFMYWHVLHLPFAIIMLIFMIMHVIVTVALGYKWIF